MSLDSQIRGSHFELILYFINVAYSNRLVAVVIIKGNGLVYRADLEKVGHLQG